MVVVNFVGRPVRTRNLVSFSFTDLPEQVFPFQWQRFCEDAVSLSHVLIDVGSMEGRNRSRPRNVSRACRCSCSLCRHVTAPLVGEDQQRWQSAGFVRVAMLNPGPELTIVCYGSRGVERTKAIGSGWTLGVATWTPNQLELALLNLAVNARDAIGDGGTTKPRSSHLLWVHHVEEWHP